MDFETRTYPALTRQQICRYAGAVRDFNPIHVDEQFATSAGLPSVIAHGPLTLAFAIDAIVDQYGAGSLRSFRARLKAPFTPGEPLAVVATDDGVELRTKAGSVVATAVVELD